ncbi:Oligo-1-6-glucosidase [Gluconacetobacter sp. SXCC-1]|uniref:Alpha-glucosidase n=1 Tax=Komagataeibacter rhaeticus TaxID=215221 RepID=A0A181CA53_9PROT|nr:alpha-glucosidase [Komagataeibacter rhaeticus]ATU73020.1 alpha-glucosidase [Komagataeibacter xylinus]EGG77175.1 Oligo-1-6-glucosidase [Gluconacetobacter sp. SXCC-1]QIP35235.1 alpha-glucosidase [Komagataeibacter rhaeticus]QOC47799.1 alpha-glucosidase [Komagataeibacter rhaeticus]WPP22836.1 alpha-glucosidase [Komagataeibacter rhaeticus]
MDLSRRDLTRLLGTGLFLAPTGLARARAAGVAWWKDVVAYEIYPRSFQDGNGDGIGDFVGMAERVDYLADLGIGAVWIAACFDSPNADNGYDVRDYRKIMPDFGTMADFERFMARAKARGIHVILDMVFNHTSDEHEWFVHSRSSRTNPYRDYYIWRDGHDGGPPTNWKAAFGAGSAWQLDATTGQYYLHTFVSKQPDLNWENPKVRAALYDILRFWAQKGVSGFRFDAITSLAKPRVMKDFIPGQHPGQASFAEVGPGLDAYLHEMHTHVFAGTDLYTVGEAWGATHDAIIRMTDDRRGEITSAFRFDLQLKDADDWRKLPCRLEDMRAFNADNAFNDNPHVWPLVYLEDHDFPRAASRYGSARPEYGARSAKLLGMMMLSLRGTPYIYQGQEIGMTNFPFERIEQYDDVQAHNGWRNEVLSGRVPAAQYLSNLAQVSRDNARTPMQWDDTPHAGFTTARRPWFAVNPNYRQVNVRAESADPDSVLSFYRAMIRLRRAWPCLSGGQYEDISVTGSQVYAYTRREGGKAVVVILNFSDIAAPFTLPGHLRAGPCLMGNMTPPAALAGGSLALRPWESVIYQLVPS